MPRDTQVLPRVAFCVPHCQFHHCLLKSVPIRPWVYKPLQRTNSTGLMIYSYLCLNTTGIFVGELRKRTLRNWFYTVWLLCSDVTELCWLFFFLNSFFSGNRKSRLENQTWSGPVGEFQTHELPDLVFRRRNRSGKSSVGVLFFVNRPPLSSPGRHFQLLAVANSVGIEKPTMGSPGEDNRCYWLTLLTDP